MNEIEILRVLRKKKVLRLNEVHETEDSIYLITDCIHNNTTLKQILKAASATPLSTFQTKTIMYQLLKILAHMASNNIAHRNLKPSSVLVEDDHNIRIINFGLATYINSPKANVGICGTPGYIAPEVLNCHHEDRVYDDKVDVFSAGCIFFEMLFGKPLFESSKTSEISTLNKNFNYSELVQFVMKEQSTHKPLSIKLGLDLLLKLLHNDPKQRISAKEALRDGYFKSQESSHSDQSSEDESETPTQPSQTSSPTNNRKRVSFDLSPNFSNCLRETFSEAFGRQENSTLYPSNGSLRKWSEDNAGRCKSPYILKNQSKFKSTGEMKLPIPPKRGSVNLPLQKIKDNQNEEDSSSFFIFDEAALSLSKSCPLASPEIKKHPNQRI